MINIITFYYFDSSEEKKFTPKQDIDDVVEYLLKDEPELFNSTLSRTTEEYYDVGGHYIARISFDRTVDNDGETLKWKEVNYVIPVNEEHIMNVNIMLEAGKKQAYLKGEEAVILSLEDHGKKVFTDYIRTQSSKTKTAAIGSVTRNTGTAAVAVSEPVVKAAVNVHTFVLNTNTGKFHLPNCSSVGQMKSSNRWDVEMTRDEVISMGYVPCKRCHP